MTLFEIVFALFMFAGSSTASLFALSTATVQLGTLNDMRSVHDAADEVCAQWYAGASLPQSVVADGKVCKVSMDDSVGRGEVHFEIQSGNASQSIWVYVGS